MLERPDCYSRFIDPALRHLAPQLVRDASGAEAYAIPGTQRPFRIGVLAGAGMTLAERKLHFLTTRFRETRRNAWDARQRVADQERDGIAAEVLLDLISGSQLLWANDFPHADSIWPRSQELLAEHAAGVPKHELRAILRENAETLFRLPLD